MKVWQVIALCVALCVAPPPAARADIVIDITRGHLNPMPIAIPDFIGAQAQEVGVGKQVAEVIRANLTRSSLFRVTDIDEAQAPLLDREGEAPQGRAH